jgi:hypothetical protein
MGNIEKMLMMFIMSFTILNTLLSTPVFGDPDIPSSDEQIRIKSDESIQYIHRDLIDANSNELWKVINEIISK